MAKIRIAVPAILCGTGAVAAVTFSAWGPVQRSPDQVGPVITAGEPTVTAAIAVTTGATTSLRGQDDLRRMKEVKLLLTAVTTTWKDLPRR